jgi:hypothetical protein
MHCRSGLCGIFNRQEAREAGSETAAVAVVLYSGRTVQLPVGVDTGRVGSGIQPLVQRGERNGGDQRNISKVGSGQAR